MPGSLLRVVSVLGLLALGTAPVLADDWIAQKLRGRVLELVDGDWQVVARGDAVPDTHPIRTVGNSRVLLVRGTETVELGPNTLVQIVDRDGQQFTTVKQAFGEVKIEADIRNVEHFAVETPHLAAVVKGTIFVVRSGKSGAEVEVERGHVAVASDETHSHVTLAAGQSASVEDGSALVVAGNGELPVVVGANGLPVSAAVPDGIVVPAAQLSEAEAKALAKQAEAAQKAAEKAAKDAEKAAEKAAKEAAKDAEKAAKEAEKSSNGGNGNSGNSGHGGNSGNDEEDD